MNTKSQRKAAHPLEVMLDMTITLLSPPHTRKLIGSLKEAIAKVVTPTQTVFISGNDARLSVIEEALYDYCCNIKSPGIRVIQLLSGSGTPLTRANMREKLHLITPFPGAGARTGAQNINNGLVTVLPMHLSCVPWELEHGRLKADVAIVHTSAPCAGNLHLAEGGIAMAAVAGARTVIAVANKQYPFLYGDCNIPIHDVDYLVEVDVPPATHPVHREDVRDAVTASNIATLLNDGDIIQMGIGNIPKMVLRELGKRGRKNLSIWSEVLLVNKDLRSLIESGVITGTGFQELHRRGYMYTGIVLAETQEDYAWLRKNHRVLRVLGQDVINNYGTLRTLARNEHRVVSVNAALMFDLFGQGAAHTYSKEGESIFQSGFGGSNDFNRGADQSIIALPSTRIVDGKVMSNIVPCLPEGTHVTYGSADVKVVVTEYGIVHLSHLTLLERAEVMVRNLVHPDLRESVLKETARKIPAFREWAKREIATLTASKAS